LNIIREFIRFVIAERIKSNSFDLNYFKGLTDLSEMNAYAKENLKAIASGSSRNTFLLTGKRVLKIAKSPQRSALSAPGGEWGIRQNQAELNSSKNSDVNYMFTKVYDHDTKYRWLISELVNPFGLDDYEYLETYFGLAKGKFASFIEAAWNTSKAHLEYLLDGPSVVDPKKAEQLATFINDVRTKSDVVAMDFYKSENWGRTPSGNVVLLDYGLSSNDT